MTKRKNRTKTDKKYLECISELGCIVCLNLGYEGTPCEIHHIRSGQGAGQRADDTEVIGLCHPHHRTGGYGIAFHAGKRAWEEKHGTERELLAQTKTLLGISNEQFND